MNHVILIGRIANDIEKIEDHGTFRTALNLAVQRNYKNIDGIYETDFIPCILWNGIAERANEYCKKGDIVCIRGRLQTRKYVNEHDETEYSMEVIAETISFVSSYHSEKKEA